jgi:hypothetical protein
MLMAASDERINQLFAGAWEIAAQRDPILLARHQHQNISLKARERIGETGRRVFRNRGALELITIVGAGTRISAAPQHAGSACLR